VPLEGNALHPMILQIKQVVCTCSQQAEAAPEQTQLASLLITLLNSQNNRRALSRGQIKRKRKNIGSAGFILWWLRHCFPAFKVSTQKGLF